MYQIQFRRNFVTVKKVLPKLFVDSRSDMFRVLNIEMVSRYPSRAARFLALEANESPSTAGRQVKHRHYTKVLLLS